MLPVPSLANPFTLLLNTNRAPASKQQQGFCRNADAAQNTRFRQYEIHFPVGSEIRYSPLVQDRVRLEVSCETVRYIGRTLVDPLGSKQWQIAVTPRRTIE
jgi:hypothetical protein